MSELTKETEYDIRYTTMADEPALRGWLLDESMRYWYPPSSASDAEAFVRNWIGFSRYNCSLTAVYKEMPVGVATLYLMLYIKVAHLCMMYMAVDPKWQRQGIGSSLLKNLIHLAKTRFTRLESMHVEVFDGAPIIELLKRQGFNRIIRQEEYVMLDGVMRAREVYEVIWK